ncbi:C6 zinc finger domain-containing protein [Fusarium phyllophilum]|uniref:C6 zinc finger domain-containing protein n=1 Tax=Fusarium phyllophilum TaxID=47803 RepID=A0A8H5KDW9_9HYPO|nr:C6 zinc finger domain-containing protein [Fusarium phyllophilum]
MCTYRLKPQNRARKASKAVLAEIPESETPEDSHGDGVCPTAITTSNAGDESGIHEQLVYGPTSTFAFLQTLHNQLIHRRKSDSRDNAQSLDAFTKRSIFFGLPYRVDQLSLPSQQRMEHVFLKLTAIEYLDAFDEYSSHALPFIDTDKIRVSLDSLYSAEVNGPLTSQDKALLCMILAIGALSTSETDTAETLLIHAKREVVLFDDVATLSMVQFCLLMSDYQLNMGRPNAAYLQVCSAYTRSIAMGLHDRTADDSMDNDLQVRLTTFWAMYFQQMWTCFIVGRKGILKRSDISCQYPDDQPMLVDLCNMASILEMYENTRKLHLRAWGAFEDLWFGPSPLRCQGSGPDKMPQLLVCNIYYHFIHTIYRPFLIAESALRDSGQMERANTIWLRQACRYATDAAEDSIVLTHQIFKALDTKGLIDAVEGYMYRPPSLGMEDPSSNAAVDHHRNSDQARERSGLSPSDHIMDMPTSSISGGEDYMFSSFLDLLPLDPSFVLMVEDETDMVE